jgi:hypothetical protein
VKPIPYDGDRKRDFKSPRVILYDIIVSNEPRLIMTVMQTTIKPVYRSPTRPMGCGPTRITVRINKSTVKKKKPPKQHSGREMRCPLHISVKSDSRVGVEMEMASCDERAGVTGKVGNTAP